MEDFESDVDGLLSNQLIRDSVRVSTKESSRSNKMQRHPKCGGTYDDMTGEYDCAYESELECDQCKYGHGRKDPEAQCNQY